MLDAVLVAMAGVAAGILGNRLEVARAVAEGRKKKTTVDPALVEEYLGPPRFEYGELEPEDQTGAATGLVVTEVGGEKVRRMVEDALKTGVSAFRQVTQRFPSGRR